MVGNKLIQLKEEISHYIGIPYWRNKLKDGKIIKEGAFGGKGTCQQIAQETIRLAQEQKIDLTKFNNRQIYNFQKKNNIGIDCSGLAYNLLDKYSQILKNKSIFENVIGTDSKLGPRRVSANLLTNFTNSISVNNFDDIQTGDLIRMDGGKHVVVIIEKKDNIISYVNSSEFTQIRGVHYGQIEIIKPKENLNHQKWSDITNNGKPYNELFYPEKGDGIFRLKCLI